MDVNELVQSKWLTAQDVKESPSKTVVLLTEGNLEEATSTKGEKYKALVAQVQLDGSKVKDWRINRTSLKKLVAKFGSNDTKLWIGKPIVLTTMLMQGGREGIVPI